MIMAYGVPAVLIILGWITMVLGVEPYSTIRNLAGYGEEMIAIGVI